MYIAAQTVGILAVAAFLLSYQMKKRKNIILVNATSNFLYVLQYIMLGAFEGAVLDFSTAVSTVAAHNKDKSIIKKNIKLVIIIVNLVIFAAGMSVYKNIFSLFPIVGAMLQADALWITDEKIIRRISFLGAPFWLVYNLVSHAYGSAIGSALSMVSIGIAIYRYDIFANAALKSYESDNMMDKKI